MVTSLSPSRGEDFKRCPLLYRLRVIDRLPERPSVAASRGRLVHAVLEAIFDLPADRRTPDAAVALIEPTWERLRVEESDLGGMRRPDGADALVRRWFTLEDPTRIEPADRELMLEADVGDGLTLRGIVDRLDVSPTGAMRVVDYKTGRSPSAARETAALFQLKFYALILWRLSGDIPQVLDLVYLGDGTLLRYVPDEVGLRGTERIIAALVAAIEHATATGDWPASPSGRCSWCSFKPLCPAYGGTPPPLPAAPSLPEGPGTPVSITAASMTGSSITAGGGDPTG